MKKYKKLSENYTVCDDIEISYIYLLQLREHRKLKLPIFKVGKTKQENHKRFDQYPKNSLLLLQTICTDCDTSEMEIKKLFKTKYTQCTDIGVEYFNGDYKQMILDIYNILSK